MFKQPNINDPHELPLGEGEQYLGAYPVIDDHTHTYWLLACIPVVKFVAIFVVCIGWFAAEYRDLVWRDRFSRAILRLHDAIFGCGVLHITSSRLVLTTGSEPAVSYRLAEIAGIETAPRVWKGDFFIHLGGERQPVRLWVLDRQRAAADAQGAARP